MYPPPGCPPQGLGSWLAWLLSIAHRLRSEQETATSKLASKYELVFSHKPDQSSTGKLSCLRGQCGLEVFPAQHLSGARATSGLLSTGGPADDAFDFIFTNLVESNRISPAWYVCAYTCAHVYVCVRLCTSVYVCVHLWTAVYTCIHSYICLHM